MAKISQSKGKIGESFVRIFGNDEMGALFSKVQSAIIRSGFELEDILEEVLPQEIQTTLFDIQNKSLDFSQRMPIQVVFKPSRLDPENPNKSSIQADLLIVDNIQQKFMLIEIKEGYVFDTKKSDGEVASLKNIRSWLAQEFAYRADYYLCSFNQDDKEAIVSGAKHRFSIEHVMTGRELCEILGLDYEHVRKLRMADQKENRLFFLETLLSIPEIRAEIIEILDEKHKS